MSKEEKVLLLTGASSDVGNQIVAKVADNYRWIWTHYHSSCDKIKELQKRYGNKVIPIQADFRSMDSTRNLVEGILQSGRHPDHVVHLPSPKAYNLQFHKCDWSNFEDEINVSLRPIITILTKMLPRMTKQRYGKIVFMLSSYVIGVPPKFQSPYITTKYALLGLMRNLASEYANRGITVNGVSPDMMETKFLDGLPEMIIRQNAMNHPLGRNIDVAEVVPAFEYLLSDQADAVTGQNIGVTGGVEIV